MTTIRIPELALVVLIGPSGSGKTTFAAKHFLPYEVLSSDRCRALVSDDENNQAATPAAFEVLNLIASKRLEAGKLTVVDATNVQPESRKPLVDLARKYHCVPAAIVFDVPERVCQERNRERKDRDFGTHVVAQQVRAMRRGIRQLQREGFRHVHVLKSPEEMDQAVVSREPLWNNRRVEHGPFDIIGDIHGCYDELLELLRKLGYSAETREGRLVVLPPAGRKLIFLGDIVDRGPRVPEVLRLVMSMVDNGFALCLPGNHEIKLMRRLRGKEVQIKHGLAESLAQLAEEPEEFRQQVAGFIDSLVSHYVFDDGNLVVAHAGMKEEMQGRGSGKVREFALFGETTGETDEFGLPVRHNWAAEYRGPATVVYGHTPVPEPEWLNKTINIDTGCVFGGALTALRYPELELVSVPARETYAEPARPFLPPETERIALSAQQAHDDLLVIEDVIGKRIVETRLRRTVTVREENAAAALEVMSRFAANPKWIIYLPPTMSPSETSTRPGYLEYPTEAFEYYRSQGAKAVVCEEKHMGSRIVVVVCRDEDAARRRFGIVNEGAGVCLTRTGRRFFSSLEMETEFMALIQRALDHAGMWDEFSTDWFCLDCELMPWSAKAQELLRVQYAATGAAATAALTDAIAALAGARQRGVQVEEIAARIATRSSNARRFVEAYGGYCWPVHSVSDLRIAPFHVLASEAGVHTTVDHLWHMKQAQRMSAALRDESAIVVDTAFCVVDLMDRESEERAIGWWEDLTRRGGEGMVVKPLEFTATGRRGLIQPALKCRGPEYLRIIYGPDYTDEHNLERLRNRTLAVKRSLALREFALGVEALERFVRREPLRRIHECVFGVLALESEPVDPRL